MARVLWHSVSGGTRLHVERTAVHADDAVVDDDAEGEEVEHVCEVGPDVRRVVFTQALRVKPVRLKESVSTKECLGVVTCLRYCARLVVSTDELYAVGISQLQTREQGYRLDAEQPAVDVITCK